MDEQRFLAQDLDWLLSGEQVTLAALSDALLENYYPPLHCLAYGLLGDSRLAHKVALETVQQALLDRHTYRSGEGVDAWFYRLALDQLVPVARRTDPVPAPAVGDHSFRRDFRALPLAARLAVLLHYRLGWDPAGIARLTGETQAGVAAKLDLVSSLAASIPFPGEWAAEHPQATDEDRAETAAASELAAAYPLPEPGVEELAGWREEILAGLDRRATARRAGMAIKEMLLVGLAVALVAGLFWGFDLLLPGEESAKLPPQRETVIVTRLVEVPVTRQVVAPSSPTPAPYRVSWLKPGESLADLARREGVSVDDLRRLNRLPPGYQPQSGDRLLAKALDDPSPTPIQSGPSPEPLTPSSDAGEIHQRLGQSTPPWYTIWFDALLTHYGPVGYAGPASSYRVQFWGGPGSKSSLTLTGMPDGNPEEVVLVDQWEGEFIALPERGLQDFLPIASTWPNAGSLQTRFQEFLSRIMPLERLGMPWSRDFAISDWMEYSPVGSGEAAGVPALIVDQIDPDSGIRTGRLWLETRTGAVVRMQQFGGPAGGWLLWEYSLRAVEFDRSFSPELFDRDLPWRGGFAADFTGVGEEPDAPGLAVHAEPRRPILPFEAVGAIPEDVNLANAGLIFWYGAPFEPFDYSGSGTLIPARIIAGGYVLPPIGLGNPFQLSCQRSADGRMLAYYAPGLSAGPGFLGIANLAEGTTTQLYPAEGLGSGGVGIADFAFSPDGRRMIFFIARQGVPGSLYLYDLDSGSYHHLVDLYSTFGFFWSPDNELVGFLGGWDPPLSPPHLIVLKVPDGEVVYDHAINSFVYTEVPLDWPWEDWSPPESFRDGVRAAAGGLETCSVAPQ